jgi:hypothetical protein
MKKVITILVAALAFVAVASAQPRAVGVRAGLGGVEVSYQHGFNSNFLEADLGAAFQSGAVAISLQLAYDFVFASSGNWNFYAGPALGLAFATAKDASALVPAVGGQVGVEFSVPGAPLNFSLDWRPQLIYVARQVGFAAADIALGIRYRF